MGIGLNSFNILSLSELKLFELKINQKIISYQKKSLFKIFFSYSFYILRAFLRKSNLDFFSKTILISHVDSIKNYSYLDQYGYYIKYKNIPISFNNFLKELFSFPLYICQYFKLKSEYKNQIFEAYLNSKLIIRFVDEHKINQVVFFGYDYDLNFLYATLVLKKKSIETIQYCNSGFLGVHNLVVADKLYCRTKIHKMYMLKNNDIFLSENIIHLYNYKKRENFKYKRKIAVYTSGYYKRINLGFSSIEVIREGIKAEEELIKSMIEFSKKNIDIEIVLFIHLHNNIENISDAKIHYNNFLSLNNVRLQKENENSIKNFDKFDLGICCMSEIFFDRYELGYKTILINPFILDDFVLNSTLKNVTLFSRDKYLLDKINYFLKMSNKKYFSLLDE